jgi:UDP-N-acetylmuramate dehydrogenase
LRFEAITAAVADTLVPHFVMQNSDLKIPAAWLIERSGFVRGHQAGAVGLSTKHPLAIVNRGGASAREVVALACRIKRAVLDRFGVSLRPEPVFVGFAQDPDVDFLFNDGGAVFRM